MSSPESPPQSLRTGISSVNSSEVEPGTSTSTVAPGTSTEVPATTRTSTTRRARRRLHTLVPRGFECVAHPVFFRSEIAQWYARQADEFRDETTRQPFDTVGEGRGEQGQLQGDDITSGLVANIADEALEDIEGADATRVLAIASDDAAAAHGTAAGLEKKGGRVPDLDCPICLSRFEQPVTLTTCLHTFCHMW